MYICWSRYITFHKEIIFSSPWICTYAWVNTVSTCWCVLHIRLSVPLTFIHLNSVDIALPSRSAVLSGWIATPRHSSFHIMVCQSWHLMGVWGKSYNCHSPGSAAQDIVLPIEEWQGHGKDQLYNIPVCSFLLSIVVICRHESTFLHRSEILTETLVLLPKECNLCMCDVKQ